MFTTQVNSARFDLLKFLIILFLIFVSLIFYFHFKKLNHRILVNPSINVQYLYSMSDETSNKVWRVLLVDNGVCDDSCEKIYYQLYQIKKSLGQDSHRVKVVLLNGNDISLLKLNGTFGSKFVAKNKIYLVNPLGNLVMFYPSSTDPGYILKDLKMALSTLSDNIS